METVNSFSVDSGECSRAYYHLLDAVGLAQDAGLDAEHDTVLTLAMSKIVAAQIYTQLQKAMETEDDEALSTFISIAEHKRLDLKEDDKDSFESLLERAKLVRVDMAIQNVEKAMTSAQYGIFYVLFSRSLATVWFLCSKNDPSPGLNEAVSRLLALDPGLHAHRVHGVSEAAAIDPKDLASEVLFADNTSDLTPSMSHTVKSKTDRATSLDSVLCDHVLAQLRFLAKVSERTGYVARILTDLLSSVQIRMGQSDSNFY
jgi:hypothetical protein